MAHSLQIVDSLLSRFDSFERCSRQLKQWVKAAYSPYPLEAVANISAILTRPTHEQAEHDSSIQAVIDSGIVPQIIALLHRNSYDFHMLCGGILRESRIPFRIPIEIVQSIDDFSQMNNIDERLRDRCLTVLTNLACGPDDAIRYLVEVGAVPVLMAGLERDTTMNTKANSMWALGNMCGSNSRIQAVSVECGVLKYMAQILESLAGIQLKQDSTTLLLLRNISWALFNLLRTKQDEEEETALKVSCKEIIDLVTLLMRYDDDEIRANALHVVCCLPPCICVPERLVGGGLVPTFVDLLGDSRLEIQRLALSALVYVSTGTDAHLDVLVACGVLSKLSVSSSRFFKSAALKKNACLLVHNISTGTTTHIELLFDEGLIASVLGIIGDANEKRNIQKSALDVVQSIISIGTNEQLQRLMGEGVIPRLCAHLKAPFPINLNKQQQFDQFMDTLSSVIALVTFVIDLGTQSESDILAYVNGLLKPIATLSFTDGQPKVMVDIHIDIPCPNPNCGGACKAHASA